jgi:hypothetical protein
VAKSLGDELFVGRACCLLVPIAFGALSIALGQDANWDLRNYHWYNPYALLTGRFTFDLAAGSYYNPVLDVPLYLLAQHVPARVCGFLLGSLQGLNFVPLYVLALTILPQWSRWKHGSGAAIVASLGVLGGGGLALIGTTFYDNVVSILLLSGLAIVSWSMRNDDGVTNRAIVSAGVLTGAAIGMKLPTAIYGVGLLVAVFTIEGQMVLRLVRTFRSGSAALMTMLAFGGYWAWWLWSTFGNPIFPYFNNVFGSSMALSETYRDERFVPHTFTDALLLPFALVADPTKVGESYFTDIRLATLYAVSAITVAWMLLGKRWTSILRPEPLSPALRFVLIAAASSFLAWLPIFAIYRYIVTLEMLAPLLIAALIATWPIREPGRLVLVVACALVVAISTRPGSWGRVEWGQRFVEVEVPRLSDPSRTMVLMVGYEPSSWVIPSFPKDVPFVRLQGNSHGPDDGDVGLAREARIRVGKHRGILYVLCAQSEQTLAQEVLGRFELVGDFDSCKRVHGNLNASLRLCPVRDSASRSSDLTDASARRPR